MRNPSYAGFSRFSRFWDNFRDNNGRKKPWFHPCANGAPWYLVSPWFHLRPEKAMGAPWYRWPVWAAQNRKARQRPFLAHCWLPIENPARVWFYVGSGSNARDERKIGSNNARNGGNSDQINAGKSAHNKRDVLDQKRVLFCLWLARGFIDPDLPIFWKK